jgi:hypothetical protein
LVIDHAKVSVTLLENGLRSKTQKWTAKFASVWAPQKSDLFWGLIFDTRLNSALFMGLVQGAV